ncbi:MAG: AAA family ATPase, partial [Cocleimonas sp.]|nr:AAA family ATPase [Cocleimonas sp.]
MVEEKDLGMFISTLDVKGFRCFSERFSINFNSGLNVLVGENGSGKTAIISAIRQLFIDSESGRYFVTERDFHKAFTTGSIAAENFSIQASFDGLSVSEKIAFLPWCDIAGKATLNLHVDNKEARGYFKRLLWGGKSRLSAFESETLDLIHCIYLPPLRDAEDKLTDGRQSRLSKLLKALSKKELLESHDKKELHPLEKKVADFNLELANSDDYAIKRANELIAQNLKQAVGHHFSQNTLIQFSESNFSRIVEGLRLLFFPNITNKDHELFRSLQENSLGYNNLLYIASILAELIADEEVDGKKDSYFKLLLIEEPEAHLHPQLQIRLLNYLSDVAKRPNVQVIVTTHSTVLASSVSISSIIHLANKKLPIAT